MIDGTDGADNVRITTAIIKVIPVVRVVQNGQTTSYWERDITGRIEFNGGNGNDSFVYSGSKPVYASGGAGNDTLIGGGGDDEIYGDDGRDSLSGGAGNDRIWGGNGDDYLFGGDGDDQLDGGLGNNELWGGAGNDHLYVPNGGDHNYLMGGAGNDTLMGGARDYYRGNSGADTFILVFQPQMPSLSSSRAPFTRSLPNRSGVADFSAAQGDVLILDRGPMAYQIQ